MIRETRFMIGVEAREVPTESTESGRFVRLLLMFKFKLFAEGAIFIHYGPDGVEVNPN